MKNGGIHVDIAGFRKSVRRLARQYGIDARFVMYDQMRLWAQNMIKHAPPKSIAQYKKTVSKDIRKLFVDTNDKKTWKQNGVRLFKTKNNAVYGVEKILYNPSASIEEMKSHHNKYRTKSGRVTSAGGRRDTWFGGTGGTKNIGRWKFVDDMHVRRTALNRYVRHKQGNVGQIKAGYIPAAVHFGRKARKFPEIPSAVRKVKRRSGSHADAMRKDGSGYLEMTNKVPYAANNSALRNALKIEGQKRERDLAKFMEKRIESLSRRTRVA